MRQQPVSSRRMPSVNWVVLTMGNRPVELQRAVDSLAPDAVTTVINGGSSDLVDAPAQVVELSENLGVPGGRHEGARAGTAEVIGFLDDDAELCGESSRIIAAFATDPSLGAVALRLVDENGETARRHVPRLGGRHPERSGDVALFLGVACVVRREDSEQAGGDFTEIR